jgi:hypothetical protein
MIQMVALVPTQISDGSNWRKKMKSIKMKAQENFLGKWTWNLTVNGDGSEGYHYQQGVVDGWPMALDRMNMAFGQYLEKQEDQS